MSLTDLTAVVRNCRREQLRCLRALFKVRCEPEPVAPCIRRQLLPALLSTIAPALFYLRPSLGSYLLHPCSRRQLLPALLSTIAPALFYLRPSLGSYLLHPCSRALSRHSVHSWTGSLRASIGNCSRHCSTSCIPAVVHSRDIQSIHGHNRKQQSCSLLHDIRSIYGRYRKQQSCSLLHEIRSIYGRYRKQQSCSLLHEIRFIHGHNRKQRSCSLLHGHWSDF